MPYRPRRARGVSLVEAMVALAVMAFGTLAVLGVQTTLRMNGDVAKQRSEAVRLAQEALEQARTFATLADYEAIAAVDPTEVSPPNSNTVFTLTQTIVDTGGGDTELPRRKAIVVDVEWEDRAGVEQRVQLSSAIQGAEAALAGSLAVPADTAYTRNPGGRHVSIPSEAEPIPGSGTSRFDPPGGGGIGWVFNNVTGYIVQACTSTAPDSCIDVNARLLAGYVRSALADPPTAADALLPTSEVPSPPPEVTVDLVHPAVSPVDCFEVLVNPDALAYYCAVPVAPLAPEDVASTAYWSGQSRLTGLTLASSVAAGDSSAYRVCRYTPYRDAHPTVPTGMTNAEHPLHYVGVQSSLLNQNFLVIKAGPAAETPYTCPADANSSDFVNSNTWHHQPAD